MSKASDYLFGQGVYNVEQHLARCQTLYASYPLKTTEKLEDHVLYLIKKTLPAKIPWPIADPIINCLLDLYQEFLIPDYPSFAFEPVLNSIENKIATLSVADAAASSFLKDFVNILPRQAFEDQKGSSVPLAALCDICPPVILHFQDGPFKAVSGILTDNLLRASGYTRENWNGRKLNVNEDPQVYLANTPFLHLLKAPVVFHIPRHIYLEHCAVFAPSGHGKTQLLQHLITNFLLDDPPGMFILDSQGDMLSKIERLQIFETHLKDRLIILDPEDPNPPALNFFQLGAATISDAQIDELFNYLFTAIDSDLTAKQGTAVTYLLKLMRAIPNATIETLKDVMEEQVKTPTDSKYAPAIATLDRIAQDFFRNQFFDKSAMGGTRQQVARRLYTILGNSTFTRMFGAEENRFSARRAMDDKSIVLINTSQRFLGQEASAVFGRFVIAQCLAAAFARGPSSDLTLLVIDEASEYFDAKTERILSQARKYGLGLLFATQYLEQMPSQVKAAVNGNTSIKLAGPVSYSDAMMLSREMYTTSDLIRSMRKTEKATQFACHVRGLTPHAISLTIPFGELEKQPTMDDHTLKALRAVNARRYGTSQPIAPEAAQVSAPAGRDPDDFADRY